MDAITCTRCRLEKPVAQFSFKNKSQGIRKTWCKQCVKDSSAIYYIKNKQKIKEKTNAYRLDHLDLYKQATAKWRAENPSHYLDVAKAQTYAWRKRNPEAIKRIESRAYYKNRDNKLVARRAHYLKFRERHLARAFDRRKLNKESRRIWSQNRRARKLQSGGKLSTNIKSRLFSLQKGKCACCGKSLGSNYHLDHIIPLVLGGPNEDSNIQLLRAECNLKKNAKHPIDYMQSKGFLL